MNVGESECSRLVSSVSVVMPDHKRSTSRLIRSLDDCCNVKSD